jgi:RNA-directed DNA polymerase
MYESPHLYVLGAPPAVSTGTALRAAKRAETLQRTGSGVVLSLKHLAANTRVPYNDLRAAIARLSDPYDAFEVRKPSGGIRRLASPWPWLMGVQQWILKYSLTSVAVHDASYAYRAGRSATGCATRHLGARWLIKLDIRDFFHQFDEAQVFSVFRSLGYSRLVSFELARLCTRLPGSEATWLPRKFMSTSARHYPNMRYQPARPGYLPQGAPTSGAIANALSYQLDEALTALAIKNDMVYTRYADDLLLSSAGPFEADRARNILAECARLVRMYGLPVNQRKTRVVRPGQRLATLGLLVDGDTLRVTNSMRSRIEHHVRGLETFGLDGHASHHGFRDSFGFLNHLFGLLDYLNDVDTNLSATLRQRVHEAVGRATH